MKIPHHQSLKAEAEAYRTEIISDLARMANVLAPETLRRKASQFLADTWRNPRRRWVLLGVIGGGVLALWLLRRRPAEVVVEREDPPKTAHIIVQARPAPSIVYQVVQEILRYTLLLLARELLQNLLRDKSGKSGNA